jgi:hypothetical protein
MTQSKIFETSNKETIEAIFDAKPASEILDEVRSHSVNGYFLHDGNLSVTGPLELRDKGYLGMMVVVNGNLDVTGLLRDSDDNPTPYFVVLGDVHAGDMRTHDMFFVTGDLKVDRTLYGDSGSNRSLFLGGDLKAEVIVMHGHSYEHCGGGKVRCKVRGSSLMEAADAKNEGFNYGSDTLKKVLDEELFTDGELDADLLCERMVNGKSALRIK